MLQVFLFSCVFSSIAKAPLEEHAPKKKPFSGLAAFGALFFYIFCVVGFCYQPHLRSVADSAALQADILFPKTVRNDLSAPARPRTRAKPLRNEEKGSVSPKTGTAPHCCPHGSDEPWGSPGAAPCPAPASSPRPQLFASPHPRRTQTRPYATCRSFFFPAIPNTLFRRISPIRGHQTIPPIPPYFFEARRGLKQSSCCLFDTEKKPKKPTNQTQKRRQSGTYSVLIAKPK